MSLKNVKHVVLVLSGKGGVGKSSITTQLALSLSLQGKNVGILDIDLTGPSIPRFLGIEDAKVTQTTQGWLPVEVHGAQELQQSRPTQSTSVQRQEANGDYEQVSETVDALNLNTCDSNTEGPPSSLPVKVGSLQAMSLAFLLASRSTAIVWRGPKKTAMVRQFLSTVAWPNDTDYLLIDTPPGTSDEHISLVETLLKGIGNNATSVSDSDNGDSGVSAISGGGPDLAGAVIVTTPQAIAVSDVRKELNFCAKTGVKVLGVVENMSGYVCPCCGEVANLFSKGGGQVMAADFNVPFLGSVPVDPLWGILVEEGKRPRYEQAVADAMASKEDDDDSGDDDNDGNSKPKKQGTYVETQESQPRVREEGLLVDKYRDCSLFSSFLDITKDLNQRVEQGKGVRVSKV